VAPDLQTLGFNHAHQLRAFQTKCLSHYLWKVLLAFGQMIKQIERVVCGFRVGPARGVHMGRHASCRVGRASSITGSDSVSFLHPKEIQDVI
jgi:hypothetical protein